MTTVSPTTHDTAVPTMKSPSASRHVFGRITRIVLAIGFAALGVALLLLERPIREVETQILVWILQHTPIADTAVVTHSAGHPTAAFGFGEEWFALRITQLCAVAFFLVAIAFLSALIVLLPRVALWRLMTAAAISMAGLVIVNQVRILIIAFAFSRGGRPAFDWAHGPIGTCIMLLGIAASLLLFFTLCLRSSRSARLAARISR